MTPELHAAIMEHVASVHGEACGLLVWNGRCHAEYRPCRNTSDHPERFSIHIEDWCAAEDAGEILGVVHSHPDGILTPSPWDLHTATSSGKAWWIFNRSGEWFRFPGNLPMLGRPYAWGVSDCFTLIRDWYASTGKRIDDLIRRESLDYSDHLEAHGFRLVEGEPQRGDLLLFPKTHAGVYLGHGKFIHHRMGELSKTETLDGYWLKCMRVARCGM